MELNQAKIHAVSLMSKHGLIAKGWTFAFDTAKTRMGSCRYQSKQITLSKHFTELNDIEFISNVILHEIAHALAGHACGHGGMWKLYAKSIGCTGDRIEAAPAAPKGKYIAACPNCKRQVVKHVIKRIACGFCCKKFNKGKFSEQFAFTWGANGNN